MTAKPRREMSPRRVAKSVRTHQETMKAYGNAAGGWERGEHTYSPDFAERSITSHPALHNDKFHDVAKSGVMGKIVGFKVGGAHVIKTKGPAFRRHIEDHPE